MHKNKNGFTVVEALVILVILAVLGFVGYKVMSGGKEKPQSNATNTDQQAASKDNGSGDVVWQYNHQTLEYFAQAGTPPKCKEPFIFTNSPINVSDITAVLMPGQYRGFNYKPHGGFGTAANLNGKVDVKMPMDATLTGLTRYYEGNPAEIQYLVTFESDCGIAFRFDHLFTLSPELQAIAETRPEPKMDDTRSDPNNTPPRTKFKAGALVATAVGHPATKNYGFDFGVYDYRQRNEISKNAEWNALHKNFSAQDWHGVCWFDMLPGGDAAKVKTLSETPINPNKPNIISDYCPNAKFKTLDFNDGKPTDG